MGGDYTSRYWNSSGSSLVGCLIMTKITTAAGVVSVLFFLALVGCLTLSESLTPAEIDRQAIDYAVTAGVAEPTDLGWWLYPNLHTARKVANYVDYAYTTNQLGFQHQIESDESQYGFLRDRVARNIRTAEVTHESWFAPDGYLSMLLGAFGFSAGALLIRRPGDVKPVKDSNAVEAS